MPGNSIEEVLTVSTNTRVKTSVSRSRSKYISWGRVVSLTCEPFSGIPVEMVTTGLPLMSAMVLPEMAMKVVCSPMSSVSSSLIRLRSWSVRFTTIWSPLSLKVSPPVSWWEIPSGPSRKVMPVGSSEEAFTGSSKLSVSVSRLKLTKNSRSCGRV